MFYVPEFINFVRIDETMALLSSPREIKRFEGDAVSLVAEVLPLLQDGATIDSLVADTDASVAMIKQILQSLQGIGVLRTESGSEYDYLEWASRHPKDSRAAIDAATIGVVTPNLDVGTELTALFSDVEIGSLNQVLSRTEDIDLLLSFAPGIDPSFHHDVLDSIYDADIPWLPSRFAGREIRIGPMTRPGKGGCYHCYYRRLIASHEDAGAVIDDHEQRENSSMYPPYPAFAVGMMEYFAAMQALSFTGEYIQPATTGSMLSVDVLKAESNRSDLLKLPHCKVCGDG
jgi:bacteriocin biosynthesis cyclodehydratase domain-containing protein